MTVLGLTSSAPKEKIFLKVETMKETPMPRDAIVKVACILQ